MPKSNHSFLRCQLLNEIFNTRSGTQSVLKSEELTNRLSISLRQLRSDMEALRAYGAPLEYVAALRGWRYSPGQNFTIVGDIPLSSDDVLQLRIAFETLAKAGLIKEFENLPQILGKINKAVRSWVSSDANPKTLYFDPLPKYDGGKHLSFFLKAIEESRRVEFNYQAFHALHPKSVVFDPWFLRHYDQRWYVGGFSHDPDELFVRVFPLERIEGIPQNVGFCHDKPRDYTAETYWKNIYGITVPKNGKVESIVLAFSPLQGKYFLSSPFIEPYQVVENSAERLVIQVNLMVNTELIRKLASFGADVKILQPDSLRAALESFFQKALDGLR